MNGNRVVLFDRPAESTIHWLDLANPAAVQRLSVKTGFASNPSDYVELGPDKAYVSRYNHNLGSGRQPFDSGSDVLIIDPSAPAVTGSIDLLPAMDGAPGFLPRPVHMVRSGDFVYVVLQSLSESWEVTSSRLVRLDPASDRIDGVSVLEGLENCEGIALSPALDSIAVACSGDFDDQGVPDIERAGIAIVALPDLTIRQRFAARDLTGRAPQLAMLDYASETRLLFTTTGDEDHGDEIATLDLTSGRADVVLTSPHHAFTLNDARCAPRCGVCFVADAGPAGGQLHRFTVDEGGALVASEPIVVERRFGLPPRYLGRF
jgi:hypothetical protein